MSGSAGAASAARVTGGFARFGLKGLVWAVLPEGASFLPSVGLSRRAWLLLLGGIAAFMAVIAVALFWLLGTMENTARHAATRFAAALVHDAPSSAPPGAAQYVGGVRSHFGPVTSARLISDHNKGVNTGDASTRSYFVAELLLQTRRGPAVIELAFDNGAFNSDSVSGVYELRPKDAPALSPLERRRLARAFAARGGKPADQVMLATGSSGAAERNVSLTAPAPPSAASGGATAQLRCVQAAHGSVEKLKRCVP